MIWNRTSSARRSPRALAVGLALASAALTGVVATSPAPVRADGPDLRGPNLHALTGARLVIAPGRTIESGTLVVRDGLIEAVGADVAPPAGARLRDLSIASGTTTDDETAPGRLTLYPGLIDSFVTMEWPDENGDDDGESAPRAGHENPLVHPERDLAEHAFDAAAFKALRAAGFTTAVLVPEPGLFRGTSVVSNLGDGGVHDTLLRAGVAQNVQHAMASGGYPSSRMGSVALLRQTMADARWYADAQRAYAARPTQTRPAFNRSLEALGPLVGAGDDEGGRQRLVFEAADLRDLLRFGRLSEQLAADGIALDAVVVGNGDEYRRPDAVAALGVPLVLPVAFPEAPEVGDDGDALSVDLEDLRHWREAPRSPGALAEAGVDLVLTSHDLDVATDLHARIARAIEAGWSSDAALAALTTEPAALWGLSNVAGTLEAGKMANFLEVEGDLFVESPKILAVWVDGRRYELGTSEPPTVEPAGTWKLTIDAQQAGQLPATLRLTGAATALGGVFVSASSAEIPLDDVRVSGNTVSLSFNSTAMGMPGTVSMTLEIEGDRAKGSGTAPPGSFTVTGRRTAGPDEEIQR